MAVLVRNPPGAEGRDEECIPVQVSSSKLLVSTTTIVVWHSDVRFSDPAVCLSGSHGSLSLSVASSACEGRYNESKSYRVSCARNNLTSAV